MSDSSIVFRSAVMGGFNRQDVLDYIEEKARAHADELKELGRNLEQSQKELGEARDKLSQAEESIRQLQAASDTQKEELLKLREEVEKLTSANRELSEAAEARDAELDAVRNERDHLEKQLGDLRAQLDDIEQAKIRVANIELDAYARAKKIEDAAIENTNMARAALTNLFQDAKRRFDRTKDDAAQTFIRMSQEFDRLKEVLKHLPASFDAISSEIESLNFGGDKKNSGSSSDPAVEDTSDSLDDMQYESIVYPETPASVDTIAYDPYADDPEDEEADPQASSATDSDIGDDDSDVVYTFESTDSSDPEEQ